MNCFLRAADYYRQAEFHLEPDDPRRLPTFERMEACSHKFLQYLNPRGEIVEIPDENGVSLCGYFVRAPFPGDKLPVLICMGGLDSIKDEMWFMQAHGCLQRGISVLMVDMPGQGGTLRRHGVVNRVDTEVPVGKCIDWLEKRADVDASRTHHGGAPFQAMKNIRPYEFRPHSYERFHSRTERTEIPNSSARHKARHSARLGNS